MSDSYAVVVVRLERMDHSQRLLTRATVRIGDGTVEAHGPLVLEANGITQALSPILEDVSARVVGGDRPADQS